MELPLLRAIPSAGDDHPKETEPARCHPSERQANEAQDQESTRQNREFSKLFSCDAKQNLPSYIYVDDRLTAILRVV